MRSSLRDKSDTIDLLQSGLPCPHQFDRRLPQEVRAVVGGRFADESDRLAGDDELPNVIVQIEDLCDSLASLEPRAAALPAAKAGPKPHAFGVALAEAGRRQQLLVRTDFRG